ncbi:MAG: SAM-dependent chlorinase/fluorinase [Thermodesulfobacteriota bacterium]
MENRPITLTTDFGLADPYVGAMKGAILKVNPEARITDITHLAGARDLLGAAFILKEASTYFPDKTIHVAIIDPGVGGLRAPLIIETERFAFVGPDNGIFSLVLETEIIVRAVRITNTEYFQNPVSTTFHGRDIFAPVAGHLSLGLDAGLIGEPMDIDGLVKITLPVPILEKEKITGEIIHIDNFGNLITNIDKESLEQLGEKITIKVRDREIRRILENYSESAREETLCAIIGSAGLLEIAVNMGSAEERLGAEVGDKVLVSL